MCYTEDSKAVGLQENPLFAPNGHDLLHDLGCAELVLNCLHPCVREALEKKDAATRELFNSTCRLKTAATLLLHATGMHPPAVISDAKICTDMAVSASRDTLENWCAANATVMHRMLQHPPLSGTDLRLFQEFLKFMS